MGNFYTWLIENTISVNYQNVEKKLNSLADEMIEFYKDKDYELSLFRLDTFLEEIKKTLSTYPGLPHLLKVLKQAEEVDRDELWEETKKVRNWVNEKPYSESEPYYNVVKKLWGVYSDYINRRDNRAIVKEKEMQEYVNKALQETKKNIEELKHIVQEAISRIPHWNNTDLTIKAHNAQDEYGHDKIDGATTFDIIFGHDKLAPNFMIFKDENGKIEIDDVLEGGDEDFFTNPQIQADYFNLINELKKPGSTNKGKILTLYTARPKEHREQLLSSSVLPINIFLVNDYDHAEGLAVDLASKEARDIWKVKIDSRYLTQTLDGRIKYYQVTVNNAPAKLELISSGH